VLRTPINGLLRSDLRDTRTALHLGAVRTFPGGDLRLSLELARVHRTEGLFAGPGYAGLPPAGERVRSWEGQLQVTVGRWLAREQRVELEFEEREPETPERVWRLRWVRRF